MKEDLIKKYLYEKRSLLPKFKTYDFQTEKDKTGHVHEIKVDVDGNGKTISTSNKIDHIHKIFEWNVQPSKGHIHSIKNK